MPELKELLQSADWKKEKHAPVIDAPESVKKGEPVAVSVSVGREIPHPNTTPHHIRWIELYFLADGAKNPVEIARFEFSAHGESPEGADTSTIYTTPSGVCTFKTEKTGTLLAASYCNIHGLWESSRRIAVA
jgi:superoxide reductase